MNEVGSATSYISNPIRTDVHVFAHASPSLAPDEYEMNGITVTKTVDQKSASQSHLNFRLENDTVPFKTALGVL